MALTAEDVRAKQFSTAKRRKDGYDPDEVDRFPRSRRRSAR